MEMNIRNMSLGETITLEDGTEVLKVPGGWIFKFYQIHQTLMADGFWSENYQLSTQFVPDVLNCEIRHG